MHKAQNIDSPELNPDPITKAPGSHPIGTGVGAAAGGAAVAGAAVITGAVLGSAIGPVGTAIGAAVGAAVGAVAGGLAGKEVAESINPTFEHTYWRTNYMSRPYMVTDMTYDDYGPAYQYGWETRSLQPGKTFKDIENDLEQNWEKVKGKSRLMWHQATAATRDAWDRVTPSKHH